MEEHGEGGRGRVPVHGAALRAVGVLRVLLHTHAATILSGFGYMLVTVLHFNCNAIHSITFLVTVIILNPILEVSMFREFTLVILVCLYPVLHCVVFDEVLYQLVSGLAKLTIPALLWPEYWAVVEGVIGDGEAKELQVDPYLVHSPGLGQTPHNAHTVLVGHSPEGRLTLLPLLIHDHEPDLVADDLQRLLADDLRVGELAGDAAEVLLLHLALPDQLLHHPRLGRALAEDEDARGEPVQPVHGVQLPVARLLGEDEEDAVVAVPAVQYSTV